MARKSKESSSIITQEDPHSNENSIVSQITNYFYTLDFFTLEHIFMSPLFFYFQPTEYSVIDFCTDSIMETIIENPGLEHISQDIFELLDKKNSLDCRLVNSSWKGIVEKPKFWLKKWSSETGLDSKRDEKILARHAP